MQRELNVQETVTNVGQGQRLAGEKGVNSRVYGYVWSIVNQMRRGCFVSSPKMYASLGYTAKLDLDLVQSILCISSVLDTRRIPPRTQHSLGVRRGEFLDRRRRLWEPFLVHNRVCCPAELVHLRKVGAGLEQLHDDRRVPCNNNAPRVRCDMIVLRGSIVPSRAAAMSGVTPLLFCLSTSAPFSMHQATAFSLLYIVAQY